MQMITLNYRENAELSPENVQAALEKYNHNLNIVANILELAVPRFGAIDKT